MHGGGVSGTAAAQHARKLAWALGLTATYMVAEVIGGLVTGSLALLADAVHMLTGVGGLALALLAIRFAAREATPQRTYGYLRMEVLSALANALVALSRYAAAAGDNLDSIYLNPFVVLPRGQGAVALDAVLVTKD